MKDVVGSTAEEIRMIKAVQRAIGALDNGYIGNQTMSDIAAAVNADCFPLNVELYGQPTIISKDIEPCNPNSKLPSNSISGSFSYQSKPCSILVSNGKTICGSACHSWLGQPESVLYRLTNGTVGIKRCLSATELPSGVRWAVGGVGLLSNYSPATEGFVGAYSDVLRKTNHTVIGYKRGMFFCVYCKNMTAAQVNSLCRDNMRFEKAIMLDGGHVAAINGANNKINVTQKQYFSIKAV